MLFNSFVFALLLLVTLTVYWLSPRQTVRLATLFAASVIFYSYHHWPSVFILLGSIAFNYWAALRVERTRSARFLGVAIVADLSLLFWFKYAAFVVAELGLDVPALPRWLPLGISFFTFQVVAYLVDVYRGEIAAERSLLVFAVFKSFFAQLIAGPIVRGATFLPELRRKQRFSADRLQAGLFLFIVGIGLKIGVADVLRQFADEAFAHPEAQKTSAMWLGVFAFAFQLFADFWAYSTMARGIGECFSLSLPLNFDAPYISTSLQEFWRRWHITLSRWFRDYVYIPLGGNRSRAARNLIITMTVAGVWHGAGWTFVLWGFLHGLWLATERALARPSSPSLPVRILRALAVFIGVCLLWVLFRAPDMQTALHVYRAMLLPPYTFEPAVPETLAIWLIGFALLHPLLTAKIAPAHVLRGSPRRQALAAVVLLLMALAYGGQRYDFVYFAF